MDAAVTGHKKHTGRPKGAVTMSYEDETVIRELIASVGGMDPATPLQHIIQACEASGYNRYACKRVMQRMGCPKRSKRSSPRPRNGRWKPGQPRKTVTVSGHYLQLHCVRRDGKAHDPAIIERLREDMRCALPMIESE